MSYFLGIDVGTSRTVAAVVHSGSDVAEAVDLGDPGGDGEGVASVLHLGEDGALTVGAAAQRWLSTEPDRVVEGFPGRIGDGDPMLLAGEPWAPEELTAWLVRWVVDRVAEHEGTAADAVAVVRPASWDEARTGLLAAALAEQEIDARFLATGPDSPDGSSPGHTQVAAASAVAVALRETAAGERPGGTTSSGRHAVVGGAIAALVAVPVAADDAAAADGGERERQDGGTGAAVDTEDRPGDGGEAEDGPPPGIWDVPAPRSHESGTYGARVPDGDVPGIDEPGVEAEAESAADGPSADDHDADDRQADDRDSDDPETDDDPADGGGPRATDADDPGPAGHGTDGPDPDPATRNLIAELVGFTGGMGATNTAGLLSGYTPPHGMPAAWSGGPVAVAPAETATATGRAVALPSQRSGSGRWSAVAPARTGATRAAPALRARNNPTVLVGAGGLAAAVAVVGTLFLWPSPRITNSATSRPIPAIPVATAPAEPTAASTVVLTPEPTPTRQTRPAAPRTRRPVVPPVTESAVGTTPPPTASAEPTEPTTSAPPSSEETVPTTTASDDD